MQVYHTTVPQTRKNSRTLAISVLFTSRFNLPLELFFFKGLVHVAEYDSLDHHNCGDGGVDVALGWLDPMLLLHVILAQVVRGDGQREHGNTVEEELEENLGWSGELGEFLHFLAYS